MSGIRVPTNIDKDGVRVPIQIFYSWSGRKTVGADGELLILKDKNEVFVLLAKGGQTGFEYLSFSYKDFEVSEWCACFGQKDNYAKVVVSKDEMARAYREAGVIDESGKLRN